MFHYFGDWVPQLLDRLFLYFENKDKDEKPEYAMSAITKVSIFLKKNQIYFQRKKKIINNKLIT